MAALSYTLFLSCIMIFPMFMPTSTVSAIRIHPPLTPSESPTEEPNSNMLGVHKAPSPQESRGNAFRVLMKGRITPSGPSHRGNAEPIFTRHLLRNNDIISFQELTSVPSPGIGHR
ncbi:hypothetical protein QQP08_020517 [Theobroma cacao]|uniref:Uncharacterized protein n=1 Tax=Theobroma cacao TaxID=3641 RepID=A0A061GLE6_THECC|nr:Uncharacterized protein TCM_029644 [Theobroma cacao]WRX28030.1 hypothetical protein QQP08_020517 [Theobroma cacao]